MIERLRIPVISLKKSVIFLFNWPKCLLHLKTVLLEVKTDGLDELEIGEGLGGDR